nr:hypothetical protein CFP56_40892 [Quercus suber]
MEEREAMTTALEAMTTATGMGAAPVAVSALPSPSAVTGFSNNSTSELAMVVLLAHCSWKFEALALG